MVHSPFVTFSIGLICLFLFTILGILVDKVDFVSGVDRYITDIVVDTRTPFTTDIMKTASSVGDHDFIFPAICILFIFLIYFRKWEQIAVCLATFYVVDELTTFTKVFLHRLRPEEMIVNAGGFSFPSGHTSGAFMLSIVIGWIIASVLHKRGDRVAVVSIALFVAFMVGISRVYLGVHWMSDIYGGILLATGVSLIMISLGTAFGNYIERKKR